MSDADDAGLAVELCELERLLLTPGTRRSAAALDALLADDFVEFGQSGRRYDKPQIMALLTQESVAELILHDFALRRLASGLALATYIVERAGSTRSRRSSIWRYAQDRWQLVFHQGTAVPADIH